MNNLLVHISRGRKYLSIALLLPLFPLLNSCKDNTGNLSPNVLPKSDVISAFSVDTTTLITSMYLKDSVPTEGTIDVLLGSFNDPVFGESKASIYAEVIPSTSASAPWAVNSTVDSAVLRLQLYPAANYGGNDAQTFVVYKTDTTIGNSSTGYFSTTSIPYNPTPIGTQQVIPPNTTVNDTLRIKLDRSWWYPFSNNMDNPSNWTSAFNQFLKGIYITTATPLQLPGQGSLINVAMANSVSGIYFYYHSNSNPAIEESMYFQIGGPTNQYFIHFDHNYSTTVIGSTHPSGKRDSINGSQLVYVQAMGGVIGRINFPNLYKNWSKLGHILVNEAEITLPCQPQTITANYGPPQSLFLLATDTNWAETDLNGMPGLGQPAYFTNNSYSFIITQYIQSVINGKITDRGLYILPNTSAGSANGVVLYGAQHGVSKAQQAVLTIYYTPAKNP
jgi:hypothetical protein